MLTLHTIQTKTKITLLKEEFFQLIKKIRKIEPVEIIDEDPDYLTEEEMKARTEAFEEDDFFTADDNRAYQKAIGELKKDRAISLNKIKKELNV